MTINDSSSDWLNKILRMGLTKQELVALLGEHTLEFSGEGNKSGFKSRWTQNPYVFDNTYFSELLLGEQSKYFKLP